MSHSDVCTAEPDHSANCREPWYVSTLALGLAGGLLLWAALPPLSIAPLGWVAPMPWLLLIRRSRLSGRRPYRTLWFAGLVFWLLAVHWLRLPHPATSLGWLALAAYLAIYLPLFVAVGRGAVHAMGVPMWLAAPVVWTGLEFARAHLLTGFLMAALAHTQVQWLELIQISDLVGGYGVSFLMILVSAAIVESVSPPLGGASGAQAPAFRVARWLPVTVAAIAVLGTWTYGRWRLDEYADIVEKHQVQPGPRVALIQGNSLATWKHEPDKQRKIMDEYVALSHEAVRRDKKSPGRHPLDLIIWPETMFRSGLTTFDEGCELPSGSGVTIQQLESYGPGDLAALTRQLKTPILVGIDRVHYSAPRREGNPLPVFHAYNSSVLVNVAGEVVGTYDKVHRVMFGEYIPLAQWLPLLYRLTPLTGGIQAGAGPVAMKLGGICYAPSICYETAVPHVIRRQVAELANQADRPDVLVNLTNDAWYRGSSELDMHLACDVFRAVENRTPMVVAANGGISASVDSSGRVVQQSPRQAADVILADVQLDPRSSVYTATGDLFAAGCLAACIGLALASRAKTRRA